MQIEVIERETKQVVAVTNVPEKYINERYDKPDFRLCSQEEKKNAMFTVDIYDPETQKVDLGDIYMRIEEFIEVPKETQPLTADAK